MTMRPDMKPALLAVALVVTSPLAAAQVKLNLERTDYPADTAPTDIVSADVNGDGWADLITVSPNTDEVSVWLSVAGQSFAPPVAIAAPDEPIKLAVGRLEIDVGNLKKCPVCSRHLDELIPG